ncbi:uncharacterized protein LOC130789497 isoform X2 [Actinidia eriantha]|uniref:uncharacterized protein LOC130789497 isoform X2 n=1 Tax=Actinidia eriantha TaxID=165200 RepID=UPI002585E10C|nr:uncharacterized protein LOC130789497 isoform X2 [Actinidia eriantha]
MSKSRAKQDATLLQEWKAFQTVIFLERDDGFRDSEKIAAFDFDGCLVKTSVDNCTCVILRKISNVNYGIHSLLYRAPWKRGFHVLDDTMIYHNRYLSNTYLN